MWYIFRGINRTKKEIYHGVSETPNDSIDKCKLISETTAIKHWNYDRDDISWKSVSNHITQKTASEKAYVLEKSYSYRGRFKGPFKNIQTAGN
ncbi:MAG: hypothetical protein HW421_2127 [Ignavibacteria bacterium]|nr:hypothetical protein [Ignavibacteria bacterium]